MQVEPRVGGQHPRAVPRKVGIALVGVTLLLLLASSSAQASTTPLSAPHTAMPMGTPFCGEFHHKSYITAYGFVHIGYTEIDVGVCYDSNYRPTISWGPFCPSQWFVPFIRMTANNYCSWYRSGGSIIV